MDLSSLQRKCAARAGLIGAAAALGILPVLAAGDQPNGDYGGFYTWPEMRAELDALKKAHPRHLWETSLGRTYEGREIPLFRISADARKEGSTPEVLLLSGCHPREQQPQICTMRLLRDLLEGYGKDPRITRLLDERQIWLVPMFNVDGKVHDMQHGNGKDKGADWRKNRRPGPQGTVGVDLNRNFGVRWGGNRKVSESWNTTTDNPAGNIYEGAAPLSEPENQALARFMTRRPLRAFVDIHSPFRTLLFPQFQGEADFARHSEMAQAFVAEQKQPYPFTQRPRAAEPPPAVRSGDTGLTYTWSYYTEGIYSFNLEIGLTGRYPPPTEIEKEYAANLREPLLRFIQSAGELPPRRKGSVKLQSAAVEPAASPGKMVSWSPKLAGEWEYAVVVSPNPEVTVVSEFRRSPLRSGFTLQVQPGAKPGSRHPLTLYVWDKERRRSVVRSTLEISAGR